MARAHYVAKARKDNPAVKAGEPYWWWQFRYGPKRYSATCPKSSQLTQGRWGEVLIAEEAYWDAIAAATCKEDLAGALDEAAGTLRDTASEFEDSIVNMPESLQDSDTAQRIQERVDVLNDAADEFECFEFTDAEEAKEECDDNETPVEAAFRLDQSRLECEIEWPSDPY